MEKRPEKVTRRIVLTGPESTGKSWLSLNLAKIFNTIWLPEYARFYIKYLQGKYQKKDVIHIAKTQIILENELALSANKFLFIDTSLIISKIWLLHLYNDYPKWIDEHIAKHNKSIYLLCYYDLPWIQDPLRENEDKREFFFDWYRKEMENFNLEYYVIKGDGEERLENAAKIVNSI